MRLFKRLDRQKHNKIFIVDDDKELLEISSYKLRSSGYKNVLCLNNGKILLKILPYSNADVIISDINMEEISGQELFRTIRKSKEYSQVKFLIMSGGRKGHTRWIAKADGFLDKPFDHKKLVRALEKLESPDNKPEKRVFKRYEQHKEIVVDPAEPLCGSLVNISLSGLCFVSSQIFSEGDKISLGVRAWGDHDYRRVTGTVVRKSPLNEGCSYGVRFEENLLPR